MSSTEEKPDLKAGHAPAVKAGGMRIIQHKHGEPIKPEKPEPEEEEEYGAEPNLSKAEKHNQSVIIAGAVTKGDRDFPPEAVKSYHDKPIPAKDKRPMHTQHHIHQPGGK